MCLCVSGCVHMHILLGTLVFMKWAEKQVKYKEHSTSFFETEFLTELDTQLFSKTRWPASPRAPVTAPHYSASAAVTDMCTILSFNMCSGDLHSGLHVQQTL